jgi:hypothetical protein
VTFLFWHTLVNPRGDLAAALHETNVVAFVATAVGFVLLSGGVWLWFALKRRRARREASVVAAVVVDAAPAADAVPVDAAPAPVALALVPPAPTFVAPAPAPAAVTESAPTAVTGIDVPPAPAAVTESAPAAAPPATIDTGTHPVLEFELMAVGNRRLRGRVRLLLRPEGVGVAGTWITARADRIERMAGVALTVLLVLGFVGIVLLTTVPGFRFYRVPWLIPSAVVAATILAAVAILLQLWRSRQRWSGEVVAPAALLVRVRRSFSWGRLIAACIFLTPIGGVLYATLVGRTIVRIRGPFDPERTAVVEVRLRCRDRDEANDVAARVAAIQGAAAARTGGSR